MKLLRQILGPFLALLLTFGSVVEVSAPVTVAAAGVVLGVGHAQAATPAQKAVVLNGVASWSIQGTSADFNFARNAGSCAIKRIAVPCSTILITTRASAGYGQWADGHLSSFAANVPRITDLGLLVEVARTNLLLRSDDLSNAVWFAGGQNPTVVSTNNTAPDGTATATRLTFGNVSAAGTRQLISVTNNQPVVITVYVKLAPSNAATNFRITTNNIGAWNTGGDAIIALTNTWQRVTLTYQNTFGTGIAVYFGAVKSDSTEDATCKGDVLIWGADFNDNNSVALSHVTTLGVTATRAADVISLTGAASTAALAAKAAYVQSNLVAGGTLPRLLHYSGGAFMDYASNTTTLISNATNTATATMGSGTYTGLVHNSYGMGPASITAISNNGTKATSANAWAANTGTVYVGSNNGSNALNGYMPRLAFGATFSQFDGVTQ